MTTGKASGAAMHLLICTASCPLLALTRASPTGTAGGTGPDGTGTALQERRPALFLQGGVQCLCLSSSRPSHCFHPMYHPHSSQLRLLR